MQIIFNALQTSLSGGIGRYSYELAKALYDKENIELKIVIRKEDVESFHFADEKDLIVVSGIKSSIYRNYYEQFILPRKIYKEYPNAIVHYPDSMAPLFSKNKIVITVHDLAFKTLKKAYNWKTNLWKNFSTDLSIKKANEIIAITQFAKEEIVKYYAQINENKINVIHNGFNDFSKENINFNNIKKDIIELTNCEYILTVSTISPRKNVDGLIRAFNLIKDNTNSFLVIAGKNGWMFDSVHKLVKELKLEDRIIFTGGINDDELKFLYKNARVFVYPSFYEGFGLPPLEAMSYGIPCIVSNVSAIPEVCGDAALQVNPYSYEELSKAITSLLTTKYIENKYVQASPKRIAEFSWHNCAYETKKVYAKII